MGDNSKSLPGLFLIGIFTLFLLVGCGGGGGGGGSAGETPVSPETSAPEASSTIGPQGGVVEVTDSASPIYGAKVEVPAGALASDALITISESKDEAIGVNSNRTIEIGPEGLTFGVPVTIHIPYEFEDPDGILDESTNAIFTFNENDEVWEIVPTTEIDYQNNTVTGVVEHFSDFTVSNDIVRNETPKNVMSGYPILLVHGVEPFFKSPRGDADDTFGDLEEYLGNLGFDVWSFNYNTGRSIDRSAGNLGKAIAGIQDRKEAAGYSDLGSIYIIGHSMGGLVTRSYIQGYAVSGIFGSVPVSYMDEIATVIMLGTPNHGADAAMANFAMGLAKSGVENILRQFTGGQDSSVQMTPGSSFLTQLNDTSFCQNLMPKDIDYHVIHGNKFITDSGEETDGIVLRSSSELSEWEAILGYSITNYKVDAAHIKLFEWDPGIANIDRVDHPTWDIIDSILGSGSASPAQVYSTDFSCDPGWTTDQPSNYYWDSASQSYYVKAENNWPGYSPSRYFYNQLSWNTGSFQMTWDINISRADWSAGIDFGLLDSNLIGAGGGSGEGIYVDYSNVDRGLVLGLYVSGSGGYTVDSTPGGAFSTNVLYSNTLTYDQSSNTVSLDIINSDTLASVWSTSLSVAGGGFSTALNYLGGSRTAVGVDGVYGGVNQWAVAEGNISNIVFINNNQ